MVKKYLLSVLVLLLCERVDCSVELARGKPAFANGHILAWSASKAVDGNTNTNLECNSCLHTRYEKPAYLNINLEGVYRLNRVLIYYPLSSPSSCEDTSIDNDMIEKFQKRFMRSSIRTSATVNTIWGTECHRDHTPLEKFSDFSLFQNVSCRIDAKYVSIVQYQISQEPDINEPVLAVCEMKIYGCPVGYYGINNCNKKCPDDCKDGKCFPDYGCSECKRDGLKSPDCSECSDYTYGTMCNETCGRCLDNVACDKETGYCPQSACNLGFRGMFCKEECQSGRYGYNCNETCGACFEGEFCNKKNGSCPNKCDLGFRGTNCKTECQGGKYGYNCNETCGACFEGEICNKKNGSCPNKCDLGFRGTNCKTECQSGRYGHNCYETCGACFEGEYCNKKNGSCPNKCDLGFRGIYCKTECEPGSYGYNCNETCGNCLQNETCDSKLGHCSACEDGYTYPLCKDQCPNGTYGFHCNKTCGNCLGDHCDSKYGSCSNGCDLGYSGQKCNNECEHGFYGSNCIETCGNCLGNVSCDSRLGHCTVCKPGYKDPLCKLSCVNGKYGQNCKENCGQCKNGQSCHHVSGSCGNEGCDRGFHGPLCSEICRNNTFGYNCEEKCGFCKDGKSCNVFFGNCSACQNGYMEPLCDVRKLEQDSSSTVLIGGTAGSVTAVVVIIVVIALIVIIRKRRTRDPEKSYFKGLAENNVTETEFSNAKTAGKSSVYANVLDFIEENDEEERDVEEQQYANVDLKPVDESSYNINVDELLTVIQRQSNNENNGFIEEFQHLPKGQLKPCTHAEKEENRSKNRFKSTFPYDDTRVCLETENNEETDYINANFIMNLEGKNAYIACQGPKNHTIIDTWRMIWQENVSQIVMVTNLKEKNVLKCSKYWPEVNMSVTHGSFNISNVEERKYANFTIRNLSVHHSQKKERRVLTHFQYTTWPDHGVPDANNLITFHCRVKRVQSMTETKAFPLLVHCSAGIGRTGTFIALDALSEHCKHAKTINVFQYIKRIREQDRMNMIQTADQYAAVHKLLYESLRTQSYPIPRDKLLEEVNNMCSPNLPVNRNILRSQLMELNKMKPAYSNKDFTGGFQNQHLNMDPNVLPVNRYRVYLSSYAKGRSDYINAVTVPTQKDEKGIIVTNFPSSTNTVDFLRLLVDHGAILVSLEFVSTAEKGWVQRLSSVDIDPYTVELCCNTVSTTCNFEESEMNILNKKDAHSYKFPVFETTAWPTKYTDDKSLSLITSLIQAVMDVRNRTKGEGKIIVASKDGVTGCDVFCAVYNAMEQLELDSEVDMFNIVRQIQIRRPQFIPTMDEYTLCLKSAANVPLPRENIYANL